MSHLLKKLEAIVGHVAARAGALAGFSIVLAAAFPVWTLYAFIFAAQLTN